MTATNPNPWLFCPNKLSNPKVRLVCFPFSGGGASLFYSWANALPASVEIHAVQLPGREARFNEPRITSAEIIGAHVADAIVPLMDRPVVLFGYSLGAWLAFECTRNLSLRSAASNPAQLIVAAARAPHAERVVPRITHLPQDEFLQQVQYYFDSSEQSWGVPELLEILLPIVRDDISITEKYIYPEAKPLAVPIHVFTGAQDISVPLPAAEAWRELTNSRFSIDEFPGGHFFINEYLAEIQNKISGQLNELITDD